MLGDDKKAKRERFDLQFQTIQAAMESRIPGDTIFVFPGEYFSPAPLIVNEIHFVFLGKGALTGTANEQALWKVGGHGSIYAPGWSFSALNNGMILNVPFGSEAQFRFQFDRAFATGPDAAFSIGGGRNIVRGNYIESSGTTLYPWGGETSFELGHVKCSGAGNTDVLEVGNAIVTGHILKAESVNSDGVAFFGGKSVIAIDEIIAKADAIVHGHPAVADLRIIKAEGGNRAIKGSEGLTVCGGYASGGAINFDGSFGLHGTAYDPSKGKPLREWIPGQGYS